MTNQLNEIKQIIEEIREKTKNGLPIKPYDQDPNQVSMGMRREIDLAQSKLYTFLKEIESFGNFIDDIQFSYIKTALEKILEYIDSIIENPITNLLTNINERQELLNEINNLPVITSLDFYNTGEVNIPSLTFLIDYINQIFETFSEFDIPYILNNANIPELNDLINAFVSIHNEYKTYQNSPSLPKLTIIAYNLLQSIVDKTKKTELNDSIEKLQDTTIKMKNRVGLAGNSNLFISFNDEANSFKWKIISYNIAILLILILVLISLSLLIFVMIFTPDFKFIKDYHFYGFYISFFFFLSVLIAYLIKERSRLISHQYYCKITYLELLAIIPFTTEIEDSVKVDDLKVRLAERYFLGPNRMLNNSDPTSSITTSKLSEVIKLAQEVKSTIK